jgi:glycosyltransferase involved in cell wall biosynthesis
VRDGIEGRLVRANDAASLAEVFVALAGDPGLVARMGEAARVRVVDGFTERHVMVALQNLYAEMMTA